MKRSEDQVREALGRMLANGPLTMLPRQPRDLEVLMALAAARFEPGREMAEAQVNQALAAWLETFCAPHGVDHVTLRRCLVDARLLVRDRAGSAYHADAERVAEAIEAGAARIAPAEVMEEVRRTRESRKRAHAA